MPRGSGHPDLSQRPRREAPGLLTALAILERELGLTEYAKWQLERKLAGGVQRTAEPGLRAELESLERRKRQTLALLEEKQAEHDEREQMRAAIRQAAREDAGSNPRRRRRRPRRGSG